MNLQLEQLQAEINAFGKKIDNKIENLTILGKNLVKIDENSVDLELNKIDLGLKQLIERFNYGLSFDNSNDLPDNSSNSISELKNRVEFYTDPNLINIINSTNNLIDSSRSLQDMKYLNDVILSVDSLIENFT